MQHLDLTDNGLQYIFPSAFQQLSRLETLLLGNNKLGQGLAWSPDNPFYAEFKEFIHAQKGTSWHGRTIIPKEDLLLQLLHSHDGGQEDVRSSFESLKHLLLLQTISLPRNEYRVFPTHLLLVRGILNCLFL